MIRPLVVLVGIGVLASAGQARATRSPPPNDEDALIRHGIELRKAQDDLAARAEFQKAYDLAHSPRSAAQLGLAEFALGRWDEAEAHVGEALRTPRDPWIQKFRVELDRSLATIKTHVARVEVTGEPAGAEVYVNGRLAGQLPLGAPVAVSEGQVDVELRAVGFTRGNRTLTVSGGQYQRLVMRLERETPPIAGHDVTAAANPAARPAASPTASPATNTRAVPAAPAASEAPSSAPLGSDLSSKQAAPIPRDDGEDASPSVFRRAAKWTSLGLAGAALATGITATVLYNRNFSTFQNLNDGGCSDDHGIARDMGNPSADCQRWLDAYGTARTWLIVGYVGAGVFTATWLALALTEPPSDHAAANRPIAAWTCAPTLSTAGATCVARF